MPGNDVIFVFNGDATPLGDVLKKLQKQLGELDATASETGATMGGKLTKGAEESGVAMREAADNIRIAADAAALLDRRTGELAEKLFLTSALTRRVGAQFEGLGASIAAGSVALAAFGIGTVVKQSMDAAMEAERGWALLQNGVQNFGLSFEQVKKQIEDSSQTWAHFGVSVKDLVQGLADAAGKGVNIQSILGDPAAIADAMAALHGSFSDVIDMLTSGTRTSARDLARAFDLAQPQAKLLAATMNATMDPTERLLKLIQLMQTKNFRGAGEALANTDVGKITAAQKSFENLQEEMGTAFLPTLGKVADVMSNQVIPGIQAFVHSMGGLKEIVVDMLKVSAAVGAWLIFQKLRAKFTQQEKSQDIQATKEMTAALKDQVLQVQKLIDELRNMPPLEETKIVVDKDQAMKDKDAFMDNLKKLQAMQDPNGTGFAFTGEVEMPGVVDAKNAVDNLTTSLSKLNDATVSTIKLPPLPAERALMVPVKLDESKLNKELKALKTEFKADQRSLALTIPPVKGLANLEAVTAKHGQFVKYVQQMEHEFKVAESYLALSVPPIQGLVQLGNAQAMIDGDTQALVNLRANLKEPLGVNVYPHLLPAGGREITLATLLKSAGLDVKTAKSGALEIDPVRIPLQLEPPKPVSFKMHLIDGAAAEAEVMGQVNTFIADLQKQTTKNPLKLPVSLNTSTTHLDVPITVLAGSDAQKKAIGDIKTYEQAVRASIVSLPVPLIPELTGVGGKGSFVAAANSEIQDVLPKIDAIPIQATIDGKVLQGEIIGVANDTIHNAQKKIDPLKVKASLDGSHIDTSAINASIAGWETQMKGTGKITPIPLPVEVDTGAKATADAEGKLKAFRQTLGNYLRGIPLAMGTAIDPHVAVSIAADPHILSSSWQVAKPKIQSFLKGAQRELGSALNFAVSFTVASAAADAVTQTDILGAIGRLKDRLAAAWQGQDFTKLTPQQQSQIAKSLAAGKAFQIPASWNVKDISWRGHVIGTEGQPITIPVNWDVKNINSALKVQLDNSKPFKIDWSGMWTGMGKLWPDVEWMLTFAFIQSTMSKGMDLAGAALKDFIVTRFPQFTKMLADIWTRIKGGPKGGGQGPTDSPNGEGTMGGGTLPDFFLQASKSLKLNPTTPADNPVANITQQLQAPALWSAAALGFAAAIKRAAPTLGKTLATETASGLVAPIPWEQLDKTTNLFIANQMRKQKGLALFTEQQYDQALAYLKKNNPQGITYHDFGHSVAYDILQGLESARPDMRKKIDDFFKGVFNIDTSLHATISKAANGFPLIKGAHGNFVQFPNGMLFPEHIGATDKTDLARFEQLIKAFPGYYYSLRTKGKDAGKFFDLYAPNPHGKGYITLSDVRGGAYQPIPNATQSGSTGQTIVLNNPVFNGVSDVGQFMATLQRVATSATQEGGRQLL